VPSPSNEEKNEEASLSSKNTNQLLMSLNLVESTMLNTEMVQLQ